MDSDDDMISNLSSDDDVLQDESDNSADDGTFRFAPRPFPSSDLASRPECKLTNHARPQVSISRRSPIPNCQARAISVPRRKSRMT